MNKFITLFIFSVFLLSFSSAIKISPAQQQIILNQYETDCINIAILPYENYTITSKWVKEGNGNLSKYTLANERVGVEIRYTYLSNGNYEFCFTPNKGGNISGIIYFYSAKNNIEIGSWIDLKVSQISQIGRISLVTGNTIKNSNFNSSHLLLAIILSLLIIIFILIVRKLFPNIFLKNKHP